MFHSLLLINCVLFTLKIMFEFQLSISKVTNVIELISVILMFLLVISKIVENILKSNTSIDFFNDDKFLDLTLFIDLETINTYSVSALCFVFPFKILNYLAHFEYFSPAKTMMNTLTRATPGILVFVFIGCILTCCWASVFFFSLNTSIFEF